MIWPDRERKKKMSNREWVSRSDRDARIAKMEDGSTHMAHKAEHAVDAESGALVAVTLPAGGLGDTTTVKATLSEARVNVEFMSEAGLEEVVADKGYQSGAVLLDLNESGVRCSARDCLDSKHTIIKQPAGAQGSVREPAGETGNQAFG